MADNNWTSLVILDDMGGRFSVLTPVGLLPIAVNGIDIEMLVKGAYDAQMDFSNPDLNTNLAYHYVINRNIFETVIKINHFNEKIIIDNEANDEDHFNYLAEKEISFYNDCALTATMDAHISGNVANTLISIDKLDAYHIGYLIYFFELSVAMSGYLFMLILLINQE